MALNSTGEKTRAPEESRAGASFHRRASPSLPRDARDGEARPGERPGRGGHGRSATCTFKARMPTAFPLTNTVTSTLSLLRRSPRTEALSPSCFFPRRVLCVKTSRDLYSQGYFPAYSVYRAGAKTFRFCEEFPLLNGRAEEHRPVGRIGRACFQESGSDDETCIPFTLYVCQDKVLESKFIGPAFA